MYLTDYLTDYKVIVFGSHKVVIDWVHENRLPFKVFPKDTISHEEILKIMGQSAVYIGNSLSDEISIHCWKL